LKTDKLLQKYSGTRHMFGFSSSEMTEYIIESPLPLPTYPPVFTDH